MSPIRNKGRHTATFVVCVALLFLHLGCENQSSISGKAEQCLTTLDLGDVDPEVKSSLTVLQQEAKMPTPKSIGNLAMGYEMNGFPSHALGCYQTAEELQPENPNWSYFQALLHAARGEISLATSSIRRSLEIDPEYAPGWLWLGHWHLENDDAGSALIAFEQAQLIGLEQPSRIGLGKAYLMLNDPQKTIEILSHQSTPQTNSTVSSLFSRAYRALGNSELAARFALDRATTGFLSWNDPRSVKKQSFTFSISARLTNLRSKLTIPLEPTVLTEIEDLYGKYPSHQGVLTTAIEAYRLVGDEQRRLELLRSGVNVHPNYALLHQLLAEHYIASNSRLEAKEHLERTIELDAKAAWAHAQLGLLYFDVGSLDRALNAFSHAIEADPTLPHPYYYAGMVKFRQGDLRGASEMLQKAIDVEPQFAVGYLDLGKTLMLLTEYPQALAILDAAEKLGADLTEIEIVRNEIKRRQANE